MARERLFKAVNAAHGVLVRVTRGRLGGRAGGMPVLELITTGRRSGRAHTLRLTSPIREGSTIVLVASRGGDDRDPDWYFNVCANPDVRVRPSGEAWQAMRARPATQEERDRLWPRIVAENRWYRGYERKTERLIPLVMVEPVT
ncbi:nitroreductase/quinone reductase family protein [Frankia sp. AgKG'84/4]|uniref:nitroreductase/quinone reductase family protein n=1 Tax=Frankia sp. AgKG'84/4 TaxID=573490 RepID=UPI00200FDA50|nr:nitroreductase/quinone reductase family protein [Frankia sp. AgKG'84/4]MCL9795524.1 nitroreductase family deazaflavin-dependent oxidoreductase [Frankia sp. AgKG'84/4]